MLVIFHRLMKYKHLYFFELPIYLMNPSLAIQFQFLVFEYKMPHMEQKAKRCNHNALYHTNHIESNHFLYLYIHKSIKRLSLHIVYKVSSHLLLTYLQLKPAHLIQHILLDNNTKNEVSINQHLNY